jgi:hypothetical protein
MEIRVKSTSKYLNRAFSNTREDLILQVAKGRLPTPLTGSNRSAGREYEVEPIQINQVQEHSYSESFSPEAIDSTHINEKLRDLAAR